MEADFTTHYRGYFSGILRWDELDQLWTAVCAEPEGWYVYLINHDVPESPVPAAELERFVREIDVLLRKEHEHNYCGIVYTDHREHPRMIKIFDPHNLGSSCGSIGYEVMPRWVLSRLKPTPLQDITPLPASRKRWWQRLFQ